MSLLEDRGRTGLVGLAARVITAWAIAGGIVLLFVVGVNVWGVIAPLFGMAYPGALEVTEVCVAVAAFSFLPYCQLNDENVTADIFTTGLPDRAVAVLTGLAALVALGFCAILLWRMSLGMVDQRTYGYTTAILQIPIWWAFAPILVSLALTCVAAVITLVEQGQHAATGEVPHE